MLKLIEFNESNLYFKKLMNEDCDTMSYNAGYDLDFPGYDKQTGAIYKSDSDYLVWLQKWQGKSDRAVYIIVRESDNEFIGEVCYHTDNTPSGYDLGIVILHKYRGQGYSKQAMQLLLEKIKQRGITKVNHTVPSSRQSAIKCDLACGFTVVGQTQTIKFNAVEQITILEKTLF